MGLISDELKGHQSVRLALKTAVIKNKLPSALLFRGPEAVGKKLVALATVQDLLCEKGPPACGQCGSCLRVSKSQHEGLLVISTEELNIKLDDIQPIFDFVKLRLLSRARVVVIDDAHKLNIQASNRLLKTLEEPPPHTHFILITSQESSLPVTIRSRCQLIRFGPLAEADLKNLREAPAWAYQASQGRMDILSKLTKESADDRRLAFKIFKDYLMGERGYLFAQFSEFSKDKIRTLEIFGFFEQFLRDLWVKEKNQLIHQDLDKDYQKLENLSSERIDQLWTEFSDVKKSIEMNADRTLILENLWFRIKEITA